MLAHLEKCPFFIEVLQKWAHIKNWAHWRSHWSWGQCCVLFWLSFTFQFPIALNLKGTVFKDLFVFLCPNWVTHNLSPNSNASYMRWWNVDKMLSWHIDMMTMLTWHDEMLTYWLLTWSHDDMITCWHDEMMTWWHGDMLTWWHDDMMTWWHDDMMTSWHDDMMTWWHDDMMTWSNVFCLMLKSGWDQLHDFGLPSSKLWITYSLTHKGKV